METQLSYGALSLLPLAVALIAAFVSRSAIFALLVGCLLGTIMTGYASFGFAFNPVYGLSDLIQTSLSGGDFVWISLIVISIGILFELFKTSGALSLFAKVVSKRCSTPRQVKTTTWLMGMLIVDDYFSPLMSGPIMRPLSDKALISREKLAFILDSTTASICVLVPFMSWGAYLAGLIVKEGGPVTDIDTAITVFANSITYNIYPILIIVFSLLICLEVLPDFGLMKRAERRAKQEGKVLRDGATPLVSSDEDEIFNAHENIKNASLMTDLVIPILLIFSTVILSYFVFNSMKIAEAFMTAVLYLSVILFIKGSIKDVQHLTAIGLKGVTSVMPAIVMMALAYCINTVTKDLGAAEYIMDSFRSYMTPALFVAVAFFITALISFSTGTSWGAYALMIPFVLPIAYSFSGSIAADPIVYKAIAAVVGGGIFGDHASPVSDTSVLSSVGAGSDHMDHVLTQLPYALLMGATSFALYLVI